MKAVGDQATAERSSSKTAKETAKLRQLVGKEEMLAIDLQNELAKLQVCIVHMLRTGNEIVIHFACCTLRSDYHH